MRRTIEGRRYDTDTATLLGERVLAGRSTWLREALYRSPRGAHYFLYGEGGPDTVYGQWTRDGLSLPGTGIRPISHDAAREWLRLHTKS